MRLQNASDSPEGRPTPVLVLGGGVTALGLCRTLGRAGIPNYLINSDGDFANLSRWVQPINVAATESADVTGLIQLLGSLDFERAVLMPCSDQWSNAVAGLPPDLRSRFPASVSSGHAVEVLTDKDRLRECLERLHIPGPRTIPLHDDRDLDLAGEGISGYFLKPRDSQSFSRHFRRKAFKVSDREDASARFAEMKQAGFEAVLQEYVTGPMDAHYFVDGFVDRTGTIKALFARRRLLMHPIDFGNSTLMVSVPLEEVSQAIEGLRAILADLDYRGIFSAEFKRDDRDGVFKLLEVNVRPWWFVEFAAIAGVDVCSMAYRDALNLDVDPIFSYEYGLRHMMFSHHLRALLKLHRTGALTVKGWLRESRGAGDAVFRWSDPMPFLGLTAEYMRKAWARSRLGSGGEVTP